MADQQQEEQEAAPSPRRSSASSAASPDFSFWPSNPNSETLTLSSADHLFSNGFLLPSLPNTKQTESEPDKQIVETEIESDPLSESKPINESSILSPNPTSSKRWKDIFKVGDKEKEKEKSQNSQKSQKPKQPKLKPHKTGPAGSAGSPEISINIWPFGRSRSAGTGGSCRKPAGLNPVRKSSSAPCSRSNSRGESGKPVLIPGSGSSSVGRRWAASPARPGVHVGRASPVWQIKKTGGNKPAEPVKVGSNRVINLSVNSCIGYGKVKREGKCGGENKERVNGGLFGIKGLFNKKVH